MGDPNRETGDAERAEIEGRRRPGNEGPEDQRDRQKRGEGRGVNRDREWQFGRDRV